MPIPSPRASLRVLRPATILAVSTLVAAGCGGPSGVGPPVDAPDPRESDGLLADPGLQAVVDLQVARDGATLAIMLTDERADVRARAALALGSVQAQESLDALLGVVSADASAAVRRDAAFAVGQLGAESAVDALTAALAAESDPDVRDRVREALGKIPSAEASRALVAADVPARDEARRALALAVNGAVKGVVSQEAQDFLFARLDHSDAAVRAAAAYFFGRMDAAGAWSPRVSRIREALDGYAPGDPAAMYLVQALGRLGDPADTERILGWGQKATDWRTRSEAWTALAGRILGEEAINALLAGLDDPVPHAAYGAAGVLAAEPRAPSVLSSFRSWIDANPDRLVVIEPLLAALARQDEREFVFGWVDAAPADDGRRRAIGIAGLVFFPGDESFDRLVESIAGPREARGPAVSAISDRWIRDQRDPAWVPRYFEAFLAGLRCGHPEAELAAAQRLLEPAFASYGGVDAVLEAYQTRLRSAPAADVARMLRILALAQVPGVDDLLRDGLEHPAPIVRRIAASAVENLTGSRPDVDVTTDRTGGAGRPDLPYDPTVVDWGYLAGLGAAPRLVIELPHGEVVVRLTPEEAPHTVQTIARLAEEGRFDGTPFHRVIPNFVAQGGDVESGTGQGGPGFRITSEFNTLPYNRGSIGMASAGKDTEGSQFFIAHTRLPHLDGGYTVFGWVERGMDVVDAITRGDPIVSMRLERD